MESFYVKIQELAKEYSGQTTIGIAFEPAGGTIRLDNVVGKRIKNLLISDKSENIRIEWDANLTAMTFSAPTAAHCLKAAVLEERGVFRYYQSFDPETITEKNLAAFIRDAAGITKEVGTLIERAYPVDVLKFYIQGHKGAEFLDNHVETLKKLGTRVFAPNPVKVDFQKVMYIEKEEGVYVNGYIRAEVKLGERDVMTVQEAMEDILKEGELEKKE